MKTESKEKVTPKLKTPISYYGGKQNMLPYILPLIPDHKIYVEPFFGGGAVYWAKTPVTCEVINDVNGNVVNFYQVLKTKFDELKKKVEATLHSRQTYKYALTIYHLPHLFDPVQRAWAFWVATNQGFNTEVGQWGYDKNKAAYYKTANKVTAFKETLTQRLQYTQIECNLAKKVIQSRDSKDTFVYADPPYIGCNQGHYEGYTNLHFKQDLDCLAAMEGKFLLSSYPSELLTEYAKTNNWYTKPIEKPLTAGNKQGGKKRKIEVLTANYPI